jgi:hypothetical protein
VAGSDNSEQKDEGHFSHQLNEPDNNNFPETK